MRESAERGIGMTNEQLTTIEARAARTDSKRWELEEDYVIHEDGSLIAQVYSDYSDADFIANVGKDIPALCAALRQEWAENAELTEENASLDGVGVLVDNLRAENAELNRRIREMKEKAAEAREMLRRGVLTMTETEIAEIESRVGDEKHWAMYSEDAEEFIEATEKLCEALREARAETERAWVIAKDNRERRVKAEDAHAQKFDEAERLAAENERKYSEGYAMAKFDCAADLDLVYPGVSAEDFIDGWSATAKRIMDKYRKDGDF
jgi:hypothetical protein